MMLDKWKRAIVHLECATDSEHFYDRIKRVDELRALLDQGQITNEQFAQEMTTRSRDIRFHGTGILILHAERRYLLTARHVVFDEHSSKRELEEEERRALAWPEDMRVEIMRTGVRLAQNKIFKIIFRVPSIDEVMKQRQGRQCLMNLGAGASFTVPYTFSDPDLDLALISLDQRDSTFADELVSLGHIPISIDTVANGPDFEGQEVFTIGFPSATALMGHMSQHPAAAHWSSSYYSLPVAAFGKVSMLHADLPFFWADMSIYPGNSGGPVVAGDRMVGIVSEQATLPIDDVPQVRTRIPFAKIIKTSYVHALLRTQEQKDRRWS
jgi:S1-C subfamily serine protease